MRSRARLASTVGLAAILALALFTPTAAAAPTPEGPSAKAVSDPLTLAVTAADRAAVNGLDKLRKGLDESFQRRDVVQGAGGLYYVAYERTYRGLPVVGGDAVVVTDGSGRVKDTTSATSQPFRAISTRARITADTALATAKTKLSRVDDQRAPRLVVLAWGAAPVLAWEAVVSGIDDGKPAILHVFVNAQTGAVADSYNDIKAGSGNGFYNGTVTINTSGSGSSWSMADSTRSGIRCGGQNGSTYTGTDDSWGNGSGTNLETACVDVLYAVQREWDMLSQWLNRNGINGSGSGFPARVGLNEANAYWNGSYTNFGRNSASTQQATAIDVVAHEFGHAIFQTTPGGAGSGNENGGLNEATGDIFGALTEAFANNPNDPPDYLVGEEINLSGSGEIRNMYNPAAEGDPNCWSTSIPNTEVHAAAGPLNHWFYLVSQGSNPAGGPASPICSGGPSSVTGIGIMKAGQVYYNAMLAKTSSWRYANVRLASLNAAVNLFGANSAECTTVKNAWNAVSVPAQSGEPTCGGGGGGTIIYQDTFETATGWTANPNGTDTATTGTWERADPAATTSGVALQLGTTVSGTFDLVTGASAGASAGDFDIDGGTTSIQSPAITLPSTGTLTLSYSWYLAHLNNASSADFFRVSVVVGTTPTVLFTQAGSAANRAGAWATGSASLTSFAGQTVRLRFEAADASTGSLVEAGVDNVTITQN